MKLNEFIRELTAFCKEELNPEVVDEFNCSLVEVSFDEGKVILTFEDDEVIFENDDTSTPALTIVPGNSVA